MPVRIYELHSNHVINKFFGRPNLREDNGFRARHLVRIVEEWTVRAIAFNPLGSNRVHRNYSARQRGRYWTCHHEDDNRNKDKTRQENCSRNDLHSTRARLLAWTLDVDDYIAKHSSSDVVQLRVTNDAKFHKQLQRKNGIRNNFLWGFRYILTLCMHLRINKLFREVSLRQHLAVICIGYSYSKALYNVCDHLHETYMRLIAPLCWECDAWLGLEWRDVALWLVKLSTVEQRNGEKVNWKLQDSA